MTPAASTEEIRAAYRSLAQRLHPDRVGSASDAERALADRRMREINAAWEVLRDPGRRRAYDAERLGIPSSGGGAGSERRGGQPDRSGAHGAGRAPVPASGADEDLVDVLPPMTAVTAGLFRHLPWVVMLVVFGLIFVLTAYAGGAGDEVPAPRRGAPAEVGSCLDVRAGPTTSIVSCSGPHELRVVARVTSVDACPDGAEARRLAEDGRFDCVVPG